MKQRSTRIRALAGGTLAIGLLVGPLAVAPAQAATGTLVWSNAAPVFGEKFTGAITVTPAAGAAAGGQLDVTLTPAAGGAAVDTAKINIRSDGKALYEPVKQATLAAGSYVAKVVYAPRDRKDTELTFTQTLLVAKSPVTSRMAISGAKVGSVLTTSATFAGKAGTYPTGRARFVLKTRAGKVLAKKAVSVQVSTSGSKATTTFGKRKRGRYTLVVTYLGDANHKQSKKVRLFRVRAA